MINSIENRDTQSSIDTLNLEQEKSNNLGRSAMLARSGVPDTHRRIADNFMLLKKVFGMPVVNPQLTLDEKKFLAKFDFNLLEYSTIKQVNEELAFLQKWSDSKDVSLQFASDRIIEIRAKELKSLIASKYVRVTNELHNGYKALERYFEEISKYHT